jgi:phage recombination protein Bet
MNTQTKPRQDESKAVALQPVAKLAPSRLPITNEVAARLGVTSDQWRVLVDQIFPAAKSVEAVQMAIAYCRHRNLDIYKKPVHIVPVYSTALKRMVETVWPGISELRTTASRTGVYAGLTEAEFGPMVKREFVQVIEREDRSKGELRHTVEYPEWVRMTAYKMLGGQKCAFTARIFWTENYATAGRFTDCPNEMWRKRPHGQIEKCCEAAVLRKAFPEELGNEYAAEEMQGRILDDDSVQVAQITEQPKPEPARPPRPAQQQESKPQPQAEKPKPEPEREQEPESEPDDRVVDADYAQDDDFPGDRPFASDENEQTEADADEEVNSDYFYRLEAALAECVDEATFNDVWNDWDCMAKFDGDEAHQSVCNAIKKRQMKRLYGDGR